MSAVALLLRRERSDLVALALVTLLIAFSAFLSAVGLRLFERAANEALQQDVAEAPVIQRTIHVSVARAQFGPDAETTAAGLRDEGERAREGFPASIGSILGEGSVAVTANRLRVSNPPLYPMFMTLRYRDGIDGLAELVDGRWPASTGAQLPPVADFPLTDAGQPGRPVATDHASDEPRRFEIAVQASTAREVGLAVGSLLSVTVDARDTLFVSSIIRSVRVNLAPTELEVTGLYTVRDATSDAWLGDSGLTFDDLGIGLDSPVASINGYVPPDALPGLVSSGLPFEYDWRFPIDAGSLDAARIGETAAGLRLLEAQAPGSDAGGSGGGDASAQSGLLPLLERQGSLRAASEAVLGLAASAPLALATGALAMAAVLVSRRRRPALVLARGRGAAPRLLFAATLLEALVVATVACLAGVGLAIALVPAANLQQSLVAVAAVGLIGVVVLMAAAGPPIRQPLAELEASEARPARRTDPRRLVLESSVVVAAVVGAFVLRERGVSTASVAFDPFLAAVPPLIAIATGIAAIRLYRPFMGVVSWLAERRRDLIPALGARIVARGAASSLPVLILLLAVAFAAFTSVMSVSIERAQRTASWVAAEADVRLQPTRTGAELPSREEIAAFPGVEAVALGFADPRVRAPVTTGVGTLTLHAVDVAAFTEVVDGSPVQSTWPVAFFDPPADGPMPAILATRLTGGTLSLERGDTFPISVLSQQIEVEVVDVRAAIPGLVTDDAFVVIPYAWLAEAALRDLEPSVMWVRVPADGTGALAELAAEEDRDIRMVSRYDEYAELRSEPLVGAVSSGFLLALGVSVAYAALTILGALIQSAARRTRDIAILRTLGVNRGQQTRLAMLEHAPPILVALPVGLALGIGVALVVTPALNLGALAGSGGAIPVAIDWIPLATVSVLLAVVALAAVVVGTWLSRRSAIVNALRLSGD